MCLVGESESGHGGRFEPCEAYIKLLSEKSRLEGCCAGLELGNKINLESIKRQDERMEELLKENEELRGYMEKQARAMRNYQSAEAKIASANMENARRLVAECDPANVESEKQMNAILTEENEALRQENVEYDRINSEQAQEIGRLRQDRDRLAGIVEKADALLKFSVPFLCRNSSDAKDCCETPYNCPAGACGYALCRACVAYQEASHG